MINNKSSIILLAAIVLLAILTFVSPETIGMNIVFGLSIVVLLVSIASFFYRIFVDFQAMKKFVIGAIGLIIVALIFYGTTAEKPTFGFVNDKVQVIADAATTKIAGGILGLSGLLFAGAIIFMLVAEVKALIKR